MGQSYLLVLAMEEANFFLDANIWSALETAVEGLEKLAILLIRANDCVTYFSAFSGAGFGAE